MYLTVGDYRFQNWNEFLKNKDLIPPPKKKEKEKKQKGPKFQPTFWVLGMFEKEWNQTEKHIKLLKFNEDLSESNRIDSSLAKRI